MAAKASARLPQGCLERGKAAAMTESDEKADRAEKQGGDSEQAEQDQ